MEDLSGASVKAGDKPLVIAGAIAGLVPFFLSMSSSSSVTVNGHVTASTYRDNVAIGGGAVAVLCGLLAVLLAAKNKGGAARIGAAVAVLALGGYQLARGFGVFEGGSGSSSSSSTTTTTTIDDEPNKPSGPKAVCDDGDACNHLGVTLKDTKPDDALVAWSHGCELDSGVCCHNAGVYWQQLVAKKDLAKAVPLFEKGCKLGYQGSCTNIGFLLLTGTGMTKDVDRASAMFEKACAADDAQACKNLGVIFRDASITKPDLDRSLKAFTHACELGDLSSCGAEGDAYYNGKGAKKDVKKAYELFDKACKGEDGGGCFMQAMIFDDGVGQKKDKKRARELYTRSCDHDNVDACNNLGVMWGKGEGGPKDKAKAIAFYQKACDGKNEDACRNLKRVKK